MASTTRHRRKRITVTVGKKYPCNFVPPTDLRRLMDNEPNADVEFSLVSDQYAQDEYSGIRMVFLEQGTDNKVIAVAECPTKKITEQYADRQGDILIQFDETFDCIN